MSIWLFLKTHLASTLLQVIRKFKRTDYGSYDFVHFDPSLNTLQLKEIIFDQNLDYGKSIMETGNNDLSIAGCNGQLRISTRRV